MTTAHEPAALARGERLANRATLHTLLCICCFLLALLAMPITFQRTDRLAPRALSGAPLAAGLWTAAVARSARAQLRAFREEEAGPAVEGQAVRPSGASAPPRQG